MHRLFRHHRFPVHHIAGMDTLNHLTNTINQFVRFFESINCLFWQINWLEQNIGQSNRGTFLIVGGIIAFCVLYLFADGSSDAWFGDIGDEIIASMPLILVVLVVAYFIYKRYHASQRGRRENLNYDSVDQAEDGQIIHEGVQLSPIPGIRIVEPREVTFKA